jgi:glycosyltransferase involved in cell wall biosynthesis
LAKILEPHYRGSDEGGFASFLKRMFLHWAISIDKKNALSATLLCTSSLYCIENIYRNYGVYAKLTYLGVDAEQFRPLGLERSSTILFVGALNPAKGQDFIIESVGTMAIKPSIRFIYNFSYGAANFKDQLINRAQQLGVSITFENMANDTELVNAYNQAILTVFPSRLEPLGLVPLESMACGTPVVGVAEAGIRETIQHNVTGLLTERDPVEFGKALTTLINDPIMWKEMSAAGSKSVLENWTWKQTYQKLEGHLKMTIEKYKNQNISNQ